MIHVAEVAVTGRSRLTTRLSDGRWNLAIFCCAALLFLSVGIHLLTQLGITGDEPAYLLQGYVIIHFHMLNMANAVHDPEIYQQFYTSSPIDRVYDFRGNGVELIAYLPGYSLVVGLLYLIGGRLLIIVVQSLAGALTALLVFQQGRLVWRSRAVGLFAALAYSTSSARSALCRSNIPFHAGDARGHGRLCAGHISASQDSRS